MNHYSRILISLSNTFKLDRTQSVPFAHSQMTNFGAGLDFVDQKFCIFDKLSLLTNHYTVLHLETSCSPTSFIKKFSGDVIFHFCLYDQAAPQVFDKLKQIMKW